MKKLMQHVIGFLRSVFNSKLNEKDYRRIFGTLVLSFCLDSEDSDDSEYTTLESHIPNCLENINGLLKTQGIDAVKTWSEGKEILKALLLKERALLEIGGLGNGTLCSINENTDRVVNRIHWDSPQIPKKQLKHFYW